MAAQDQSIVDLLKQAVSDAQDLVRSEIALAKAELSEEGSRLTTGFVLLVGAAVAGVLALAFLMSTLAWALYTVLEWPIWVGFAAVTGLLFVTAAVLALIGRRKVAAGRHFGRTVTTMKENNEWIRSQTS
jgi:uncharacterized membrane protein YqjE